MTAVLIDTDPGTDDAMALMMALNALALDVVGVTTVGGNATLADTTRNALRILEYLGRADVPVYRGAARPLRGGFSNAYHVHGAAGLGVRLPAPTSKPHITAAPEFIAATASSHRGDLVIIALGPLTNVARALQAEPRLAQWTRELVVMGGAVEVRGNVTPYAEFNIYNDALAADMVLNSGIAVTLVGLDVTTKTRIAREAEPWVQGETATARLSRRILANWFRSRPTADEYYLHDPLAVAAALRPDLLTYERAKVAVETGHSERLGRTTAAYGEGPVKVALGVDVRASIDLVTGLLVGVG